MTADEFLALCEEQTVAPEVALENERIREALKQRDDDAVKMLLVTEF